MLFLQIEMLSACNSPVSVFAFKICGIFSLAIGWYYITDHKIALSPFLSTIMPVALKPLLLSFILGNFDYFCICKRMNRLNRMSMEKEEKSQIAYHKNVIDFIAVAAELCHFLRARWRFRNEWVERIL